MTIQTCPVCLKASQPDAAPFCSQGCRDRDLLNWLSEGYRLPADRETHEGLDSTDHPR